MDISQTLNGAASPSVWNSHIDTTAGARAVINIHNENAAGSAYGMRTYAATGEGDVSSSIKGGDNSTISISAASGTTGAFGLVANTQGNGPEKTVTTIEGGSISFDVAGVQNNVSGIYAAANADVRVTARDDLEFRIESAGGDGKTNAATAATATGANSKVVLEGDDILATVHAEATSASGFAASGGAVLSLSTSPSGTLQVHVTQDHSAQRTYDMAQGGGFTATGLNARNGSISVTSSDIDVSATVTDAQNHGTGTAAALYAGWQGANLEITGQADQANRMAFAAEAPDYAFGAISTNDNAKLRIKGGDHDDVVTFSATAENRGAFGIAAQAGGTLTIDGGAGNDAVRIDATFTGQGPKGEVDLFGGQAADGGKYGAYGMAAAWGGATNRISNIEDVRITADASDSANGYAYGMYTRDGWGASVQNIIESDSALTVDITAKAGDAGKAFAMFSNWGGANIIQGGSRDGDVRGDAVTLTGDLFAQGGYNKIATGAGNDAVTIHGNIVAGDNIIETGKGDDTVNIHGNVAGQQGINTGEGNDTVYIDGNMAGHNQLTINTGSGNDRVTITGGMQAGYSANNGSNTVRGGQGDDVVSVGAGMLAKNNGKNVIDTGSDAGGNPVGGSDAITITGQMRAEGANASNTVRTGAGDDTVTVDGLHATSGGRNGIDTGSGNDAVTINGSVHADGGHNNIVAGDGHGTATVDVNGSVTALSGGTSSIHAHSDTEARVTIASTASGTAYGLRASAGNTAVAADGGTVDITVDSEGGRSYGLYANAAGKNSVSADDGVTVTVTAATTAMGVAAWGADNELRSAQGDIVINTGGEDRAADAATSWGVYAQGVGNAKGSNTLDAAGNIEVRTSGVSSADGVISFGEQAGAAGSARGENILTAGGDIIVDTHAAEGYASALVAEGYNNQGASGRASNTLTAGGAIDLDVAARTTAYGISANNGGQNTLYSADGGISLDVRSETANAEGLYASFNNSATTMVAGRGDVTVDVRGVTGAAGLYASLSGVNTLVAADGDMRVSAAASQANKNAASLNSPSAHVNLSNQMSAMALYANAAGTNDLSASGSLEIHAAATGSSTAAGAAGDVGGSAAAMFALGSGAMGGTNHVAADSVKIGAVADTSEGATVDSGNAYGMLSYVYYASSTTAESTNTVEIASAADVSVHSSDGSAYGMYAVNESTAGGTARSANVISGAGAASGVTVSIDVAAGEGKDAYAMFANGRGASNIITGSAHDDVVTITGGMHVVNGGSNRIDGGGGDDTISVTGSFSSQGGGNNVIDGGAGDDTIILNGAVGAGSLTLHGGAGHDTLVLHADSYEAFEEFYSDWLLGTFGSMSIEAVRVVMHGASQTDLDALRDLFGNSVFDGADVSYEVADGVVEHGAAAFAALFGVDAESSGHAGHDADDGQSASHHGASTALMAPEAHDDAHSAPGAVGSHATPADGHHDVFAADGGALDFNRLSGMPDLHEGPHGGSGELLSAADLLDFGDAGDIPLPGLSADDAMLFSAAGSHSGDWHGPAGMTVGTFDAGVSGGYESDVQLLVHQVVSATSA